jgi:pyruvate-formate lyase-activating enzyme
MDLVLTHYGHRLITHRLAHTGADTRELDEDLALLAAVRESLALPDDGSPGAARLVERGWLAREHGPLDRHALQLRYQRNPLEHVQQVVFELTTLCNLACSHCRNSNLAPTTSGHTDRLLQVIDAMIPLGLRRFDFVGGEVTLFGRGWLELVRSIREHPGTTAAVVTSGWFLGEQGFMAANQRYADADAYLRALADAGLTHVIFSLDGPPEEHDRSRGMPGLHARVMAGLEQVRAAGMRPQVSLLYAPWVSGSALLSWVLELSRRLYGEQPYADEGARVRRILDDDMNYVSNFIDVGNGALSSTKSRVHLDTVDERLIRCKNFFRPHPSLRIQADGELSLCPLVGAATGYGNVHRRPFVEVLNGMHEAVAFRVHAEHRIAHYLPLLDRSIFGESFTHVCSLRVVLTLLARGIEEQGVDADDPKALRELNEAVARQAGFLPREGPKALGIRRPR